MPRIHVCSLALVEETVVRTGARSMVTLINPLYPVSRPAAIAAERHLHISVSDIVEELEGHVAPAHEHVDGLLAFVRAWDRRHPLIVHCYLGISRSTAAAFIAACALRPERDEREIARLIRARSPTATPNARLVALADARLGREGRMIAAIESIGRGVDCSEGAPFVLDVD